MIFPINLHAFFSDYHYPDLGVMVVIFAVFKNIKKIYFHSFQKSVTYVPYTSINFSLVFDSVLCKPLDRNRSSCLGDCHSLVLSYSSPTRHCSSTFAFDNNNRSIEL